MGQSGQTSIVPHRSGHPLLGDLLSLHGERIMWVLSHLHLGMLMFAPVPEHAKVAHPPMSITDLHNGFPQCSE